MTTRPTSKQVSESQEAKMLAREKIVLEQRIRGKSFYKIKKEFGIANADRIFRRAIARDENAEYRRLEAVRLEEQRLDDLQDGIWDRALSGDPRSVEVALKVLERRARMLGLDHSDRVSDKLVEIEEAKTRLMSMALAAALDTLELDPERRASVMQAFFSVLRHEAKKADAVTIEATGEDLL
jgi:hypothetical protein